MPTRSQLLTADGIVNGLLGITVLTSPQPVFRALGLPSPGHTLYATILGGVLVGIGIALTLERRSGRKGAVGLGLLGAVAINLLAALVIAAWLLFGDHQGASESGRAFLWVLVLFLVGLSVAEVAVHLREGDRGGRGRPASV